MADVRVIENPAVATVALDRTAFGNELAEAIAKLVAKYHDESAPGGRPHRLVVLAQPLPQKIDPKEPT